MRNYEVGNTKYPQLLINVHHVPINTVDINFIFLYFQDAQPIAALCLHRRKVSSWISICNFLFLEPSIAGPSNFLRHKADLFLLIFFMFLK